MKETALRTNERGGVAAPVQKQNDLLRPLEPLPDGRHQLAGEHGHVAGLLGLDREGRRACGLAADRSAQPATPAPSVASIAAT